jgi:hypothetical protein
MPSTLFKFVSLRGAFAPKLTTQDLSLTPKETIAFKYGFKPIPILTEEEKKNINSIPFSFIDPGHGLPSAWFNLDGDTISNLTFDEMKMKASDYILSKADYIKAVNDLEILLYKVQFKLNYEAISANNGIQKLKLLVLLNGYIYKNETHLKIRSNSKPGAILVGLPATLLIGRKHEYKTTSQLELSEIKSENLYSNNRTLLREIVKGEKPEYNNGRVIQVVRGDIEIITSLIKKLSAGLNNTRKQQAAVYKTEFAKLNPSSSAGNSFLRRGYLFFFGERQPQIIEPVRPEPFVKLNKLLLTDDEKQMLKSFNVLKEELNKEDIAGIKNQQLDIDNLLKKLMVVANVAFPLPVQVDFPDIRPIPTEPPRLPFTRPEIRNVGIGELYRVEEKTVRYELSEISFIENIMSGETKERRHITKKEVETIKENEITEETETEKDLTTSNRFNLKSEADKSLKEDFGIKGGINTSGRYGNVKVDTTTEFSFDRSAEQSRSEALETATEVVSKAVERTKLNTRELIRVTEKLINTEKNIHGFTNDAGKPHINGIYQNVDKIKELKLLHYGKRLMLEFYIPEPAMTFLQKQNEIVDPDYPNPGPFTLRVEDINEYNYTNLAAQFGSGDLESPPPLILSTAFGWKSNVEEGAEWNGEETAEGKLRVPEGYKPGALNYSFTAQRKNEDSYSTCHLSIAVGGIVLVDQFTTGDSGQYDFSDDDLDVQNQEGLGVTIRVSQHFDKTAMINLLLQSERTNEYLTAWKLRIFQRCRQQYEELKSAYLRKKEELQFTDQSGAIGRSELENRETIQQELKKWCIKALRGKPFDFNDMVLYNSMLESDPYSALHTQPFIWFHENSFEWSNMVYLFYPYFWGNRYQWKDKLAIRENDFLFQQFLQAGYAKVIVPVNPDAEAQVLRYISDPLVTETEIYDDAIAGTESHFEDLWMELLQDKIDGLARGSGTLSVRNGETEVNINADSAWTLIVDDLSRVIVIEGVEYVVDMIREERRFRINKPYERANNEKARYFLKGKLIGSPWEVILPTPLIYLNQEDIQNLP